MKCDFCSGRDVRWRYPAASFMGYVAANIAGESVGDWAACEDCHRLIEAGDRVGLTGRSTAKLIEAQPEFAEFLADLTSEMTSLHQRFFEHRLGPPVPEGVLQPSPASTAATTTEAPAGREA